MKKILPRLIRSLLCLALTAGFCVTAQAQLAYWQNPTGEWNTAANWNIDLTGFNAVPGPATNVDIGTFTTSTASYDLPMQAASVGVITVQPASILNVNTNGFNVNGSGALTPLMTIGGIVNVTANGVLSVTNGGPITILTNGDLAVTTGTAVLQTETNAPLALGNGGRVSITNGTVYIADSGRITMPVGSAIVMQGGSFIMSNNVANASGLNFGTAGNNLGAAFTNNGGTIILDQRLEFRGRFSRFYMNGGTLKLAGGAGVTNGIVEPDNDVERPWLINGGTADLGEFVVSRTLPGPGAGLVISNGVVNTTGFRLGTGASRALTYVGGGVWTNTGVFNIGDRTNAAVANERRVQFQIRGGLVVSTASDGILLPAQSNGPTNLVQTAAVLGSILDVNAGSLIAEKITMVRDNTSSNAHATLLLSGSGLITLGSGGLVANIGPTNTSYTVTMSGGTIAAKANNSINANMTLSGTTATFQAGDSASNPFNITHNGILSGAGTLNKTGSGILTLATNNTYSGNTVIRAGTLALSATASISNSVAIFLTNNATYDVSAVSGARLTGVQALSGQGSVVGSLIAPSGTSIRPGANLTVGTLSFSNNLSMTGGVVNNYDLTTNTAVASNDLIYVAGDLNLSGTNTIQVNALGGQLPTNTVYTLIRYGGTIATGGITNLALAGVTASLSNDVVNKAILMVISTGVRPSGNVTWLGSSGNSNWDVLVSSNWLNGASRDVFVSGDNARFDNVGATNPTVSIVGSVLPGSMVVDSTSNYTFTGTGSIDGNGGLTKTNSGSLTVLTTNNNFPGNVVFGGGTVAAAKIAGGGAPSSLGTSSADPSSWQFFGGALRYIGLSTTIDRGATLNAGGGTVDIASNTVTMSGNLPGVGGLTKGGPGTLILSGSALYEGFTTVSNGTLQINNSTASLATNAVILAGGTLALNVGGQPTYANALNLVTQSGVSVLGNNTIWIATDWSGSDIMNVNVNSGGFFTINSAISTNFTGAIALGNSAGVFRFNAGGNSTGAQQASGSSLVSFDTGTNTAVLINRNGGGANFGTYFLGALSGGPNTQLRGSENSGSPSTYQIGDRNQNTTFAGSIRNGHANVGSPQASAAVSILKVGTGTLTLSGTNIHTGSTIITNGVLALSDIGSIGNSASILVYSNTTLDVSARTDGRITLNNGQTLRGSGTVRGSVTAANGSSLTVGDTDNLMDILTITNNLTLQTGSTLNMELDWSVVLGGRTNDSIQGLSSVTYGGTLNLGIVTIEPNSVFRLFNAGSYSGAFDSINPPTPSPLPSQYAWDTSFLAVDGTLRITFARARITNIAISGSDLVIDGINAIPGSDYYVLSTTNVSLPLSQWTSLQTNNIGSSTFQITLTGEYSPSAPSKFYLLKLAQ